MAARCLIIRGLALLLLTVSWASAATLYTQEDIESGAALKTLSKIAYENALSRLDSGGTTKCNKENVKVYKEWYVS